MGRRSPGSLRRHRSPISGDADDEAASLEVTKVAFEIMSEAGLQGDDAVDAIRALRALLHGFVTLEAGGAFGLPADVDRSFDRLLAGLVVGLAGWANSRTLRSPPSPMLILSFVLTLFGAYNNGSDPPPAGPSEDRMGPGAPPVPGPAFADGRDAYFGGARSGTLRTH